MSSNESNRPAATIFAVVDRAKDEKSQWIRIGSMWKAKEGDNFIGEIECQPFAWSNHATSRRICIVMNKE